MTPPMDKHSMVKVIFSLLLSGGDMMIFCRITGPEGCPAQPARLVLRFEQGEPVLLVGILAGVTPFALLPLCPFVGVHRCCFSDYFDVAGDGCITASYQWGFLFPESPVSVCREVSDFDPLRGLPGVSPCSPLPPHLPGAVGGTPNCPARYDLPVVISPTFYDGVEIPADFSSWGLFVAVQVVLYALQVLGDLFLLWSDQQLVLETPTVEAKKVASFVNRYDPCFGFAELQSLLCQEGCDFRDDIVLQRFSARGRYHKVVGIACEVYAFIFFPSMGGRYGFSIGFFTAEFPLQSVQSDVCQQGRKHASHNRAKLPLEFAPTIERLELKVRYGEGFGGAPRRAFAAMHCVATGVRESRDEQAPEQSSSNVGGNNHV